MGGAGANKVRGRSPEISAGDTGTLWEAKKKENKKKKIKKKKQEEKAATGDKASNRWLLGSKRQNTARERAGEKTIHVESQRKKKRPKEQYKKKKKKKTDQRKLGYRKPTKNVKI